jgi:two-component system chemotaxis sensor kinase CheA
MNELQKDFLNQSIDDLKELNEKLSAANVSENVLREAFRALHTIKGTAQVFGFGSIGNLAHEIENLLEAERGKRISADKSFHSFLREGLNYLSEMFRKKRAGEDASFPKTFVEKLRLVTKNDSSIKAFSFQLPRNIDSQLSKSEKDIIDAAIENGKNLFLIEVGFSLENLETDFKNFQSVLSETGEIAAVSSSFNPKFNISKRLGFMFFFVAEKSFAEVSQMVLPFEAEINFKIEKDRTLYENYLEVLLSQAVDGAKRLSERLEKQIEFDVSLSEAEIPVKQLKVIFDILLHLTRNAVDHAIEKKGKITIRLVSEASRLRLTVADDGRGIDLAKTRAKAIEKNIIAADKKLTDEEILNLIFAHGFSIAETVTEISGRGVGLDAVKASVEKNGGTIAVESRVGFGTTFEIFLPRGGGEQ